MSDADKTLLHEYQNQIASHVKILEDRIPWTDHPVTENDVDSQFITVTYSPFGLSFDCSSTFYCGGMDVSYSSNHISTIYDETIDSSESVQHFASIKTRDPHHSNLVHDVAAVAVYVILDSNHQIVYTDSYFYSTFSSPLLFPTLFNDTNSSSYSSAFSSSNTVQPPPFQIPAYEPGYLSFREVQPLLSLLHKQRITHPQLTPNVIMLDGNGIYHPRYAGLATMFGILGNIPTIGIAKNLFTFSTFPMTKDQIQLHLQRQLVDYYHHTSSIYHNMDSHVWTSPGHDRIYSNVTEFPKQQEDDDEDREEFYSLILSKKRISPTLDLAKNASCTADSNQSWKESEDPDQNPIYWFLSTHSSCTGFVIPLQDVRQRIIGAVLIGHGGHLASNIQKEKKKKCTYRKRLNHDGEKEEEDEDRNDPWKHSRKGRVGTKVPIYVSVGHDISLLDAVRITVHMSRSRIPEPIRQADLIGRDLLRKKNHERHE